MAPADLESARPLSPHLQVFRPIITMMMSIFHRITGAALYFGTLIVVWWLAAAASGPESYAFTVGLMTSPLGLLILLGYTWSLFHHMLGGMRHLVWDTGRALDKHTATWMAWGTLIGSIVLTALTWLVGVLVL
ncbi:MAG: succinate dehydrogenase, cytochrome b556 subunit [Pseudomonadota bacterium]